MKPLNILMIIAIIAVAFAFANLLFHIDDLKKLTGFATDTGTANLTIVSQASLQFITNEINWGSGAVDEVPTSATIDSEGTVTNGNWTAVSQGLTLQNDGNTNVTVYLTTVTAATFIGGTGPTYKLKVTDNETNSCIINNMSSYTSTTGGSQAACMNFGYADTADQIDIDVELVIPEDALPGAKGALITATGTPI
jgi:hypothetical protein